MERRRVGSVPVAQALTFRISRKRLGNYSLRLRATQYLAVIESTRIPLPSAIFTQDPKLVDNYFRGDDLYASIAAEVFGKPIEECGDGSVYRKQAKVIMLAVAYGGGANMLKDAIGVEKHEAQKFLDSFFERFPVVKEWVESNQVFVKNTASFGWIIYSGSDACLTLKIGAQKATTRQSLRSQRMHAFKDRPRFKQRRP